MLDPKTVQVANLVDSDEDFDPEIDSVEELPRVAPAKPQAVPAKQENPNVHTRGNIRRALTLGASRSTIDSTSPDDLEDWIDSETESRARERERMARESAWRDYEQAQRKAPEPKEEEEDLALSAEQEQVNDPSVVKILKKVPALAKENAELKKRLEAREQADGVRRNQEFIDTVDDAFESLGEPDLYGEGTADELGGKDSEEVRRRVSVLTAAGIDREKDSPRTIARKLRAQHKLIYGKVKSAPKVDDGPYASSEGDEDAAHATERVVPRQPNGKPRLTRDDLEAAVTSRPTQRARKAPKTKQSAYKAVASAMAQQRINDDDFGFEEDGLPQ